MLSQEMKKGEEEHLKQIEELMPSNRSRPSLLLPLFNTAAYALGNFITDLSFCGIKPFHHLFLTIFYEPNFSGVTTALLGSEAAMACTVAVETVIGEHYDKYVFRFNKLAKYI